MPLSQQDQISPAPSPVRPDRLHRRSAPPSPGADIAAACFERFLEPASRFRCSRCWPRFGFIALATLRWDAWVGSCRDPDHQRRLCSRRVDAAEQPGRRRSPDGCRQRFPARQGRRSAGADRSRRLPGAGRAGRGRRRRRAGRARQSRPTRSSCNTRPSRRAKPQQVSAAGAGGRGAPGAGAPAVADRRPKPARGRSSNRPPRPMPRHRPMFAPAAP